MSRLPSDRDVWGIFAGGTAEPASVDAVKAGRTKVRRLRNYPADEELWARLFKRLANENDFTADEVDQLLFTQINKPAIAIAAGRCNVPMEKCHTIMEKYGYTGAACTRWHSTMPSNSARSNAATSS
jgi:3-oxoacyl-[acyl-carrier-protein] synthase-3